MVVLPRIVITAPASGHGKTTVATGLMAALRAEGLAVAGFKVGPDFIDPGYHSLATGRTGRNLDPVLCGEHRLAPLLLHGAQVPEPADMAVIEGVMGLFDGQLGGNGFASTAHVATLLRTPLVLVLDISSVSRTAAAIVHGLHTYDPEVRLAGVILNKAGSARHAAEVITALETTGLPVLGVLPRDAGVEVPSRHLGLVTAAEQPTAAETVRRLGAKVAEHLDLTALVALAHTAPQVDAEPWDPALALGRSPVSRSPAPLGSPALSPPAVSLPSQDKPTTPGSPTTRESGRKLQESEAESCSSGTVCGWGEQSLDAAMQAVVGPAPVVLGGHGPVVAIAGGRAFTFRYAETDELLRAAGCEPVVFDPLHDEALPPGTAGLYLGGGFPEVHAVDLSANTALRADIAGAIAAGLPTIAECAGLLYLCQSVDGTAMVGAIAGRARMTERLSLGYRTAVVERDHLLGPAGTRVHGHEFHRTVVAGLDRGSSAWVLAPTHAESAAPATDTTRHSPATRHTLGSSGTPATRHTLGSSGTPAARQTLASPATPGGPTPVASSRELNPLRSSSSTRELGEGRAKMDARWERELERAFPTPGEPTPSAPLPTEPVHGAPVQTAPAQTAPVTTGPVTTEPLPTGPVQTAPVQSAPVTTEPLPTGPERDGYANETLHASYVHVHWAGHPELAQRFAEAVQCFAARAVRWEPAEVATSQPEPDLDHHGDAELGEGLIDLAVNVRVTAPPRWLCDTIAATIESLAAYPDPAAAAAAIAAAHPLDVVPAPIDPPKTGHIQHRHADQSCCLRPLFRDEGGQHDTTQQDTAQPDTTQQDTTQHDTTQHDTTQQDTTQQDTTQQDTTQHDTTQQDNSRRDGPETAHVLPTAGAAEAFTLIAHAFQPRHAVVVHPQFTEPEAALRAAGHRVHRLLLSAANGFRLDPSALPDGADLVVIGNPTNPTSVLHPREAVRALARPGRLLVVDEAFMDSVPGEPETLLDGSPLDHVLVLRSLTKTWGVAGLRAGYVVGDPAAVAQLRAQQPPWSTSTPAHAVIEATLTPRARGLAAEAAVELTAWRDYLVDGLAELGLPIVPEPRAPFVLVDAHGWNGVPADVPADRLRTHGEDGLNTHPEVLTEDQDDGPGAHQKNRFSALDEPGWLRGALRKKGFAVRRCDTFPGLDAGWLRIAVREPSTTESLLETLRTIRRSSPERTP